MRRRLTDSGACVRYANPSSIELRHALSFVLLPHKERSLTCTSLCPLQKRLADEDARTGSSDHSMSRRIHFIYERALRRFKNDLQLWVEYIEYCRHTRASKRIQKVIPRALQLHPTVPGLWSYAAAYEFDTNNNAKAARTLLQRGLRICPAAHVLWQDLFRLELMYVAKLRARREILGLSQSEGDKEGTEEGDEDAEADEDKKKTP